MGLLFIARFLTLPETAIAKRPGWPITKATVAAPRIRPAAVAVPTVTGSLLLHDLLIGILDFLELLLRLRLIGIVDIGVRMVSAAQCLVCFFDFLLGGVPAHSEHTIWIVHIFLVFCTKDLRIL